MKEKKKEDKTDMEKEEDKILEEFKTSMDEKRTQSKDKYKPTSGWYIP